MDEDTRKYLLIVCAVLTLLGLGYLLSKPWILGLFFPAALSASAGLLGVLMPWSLFSHWRDQTWENKILCIGCGPILFLLGAGGILACVRALLAGKPPDW